MKKNNDDNGAVDGTIKQKKPIDKRIIYAAIAVVAVVIIVAVLVSSPGSALPALKQSASANSTTIYVSYSQAEQLIGPISNYNATDAYNPNAHINMSLLEYFIPQLYGNVTSGWVTLASSSNSLSNSTMAYIALASSNTPKISEDIGNIIPLLLNGTNKTYAKSGVWNGFNYTYSEYRNISAVAQIVYGWKNSHAALAIVTDNAGYAVNQSSLISIVANDTP